MYPGHDRKIHTFTLMMVVPECPPKANRRTLQQAGDSEKKTRKRAKGDSYLHNQAKLLIGKESEIEQEDTDLCHPD